MMRALLPVVALALVVAACGSDAEPAAPAGPVLLDKPTRADVPWEETPEFILSNEKCPEGMAVDEIRQVDALEIRLTKAASLESASALTFAPDGTGYVATRDGLVSKWDRGSPPAAVLDLRRDTTTERDQGLLGLAVHDGKLFVWRTDSSDDSVLEAYELSDGVPLEGTRVELLRADQPSKEHNGGSIVFGPDGDLYLTLGDGGGQGGAYITGRDVAHAFGSILRLQYSGGDTPSVSAAPENPFLGSHPGSDYTWIWGVRHAFSFSFDPETSDFWIADVGQQCVEEVTMLPGGGEGGEHLGWNVFEGTRAFMPDIGLEYVEPTFAYGHTDGWCAVIGGHVYRGDALPSLYGDYVFGDFCRRSIVAFDPDTGVLRELERGSAAPVGFAVDPAGELYVVDIESGIWAIVPA